jgi:exodeoxyribonuclease V alpha subunit
VTSLRDRDPFDVRLARDAPGPLRAFNDAGVLSAADVHVARRLAALGGCAGDDAVLLALALAARAPRLGHVLVDLATIRATVAVDTEEPIDLDALPWPDAATWRDAVAACPLVGDADDRPLRLEGDALYLDRYWREERRVAALLAERAAAPGGGALSADVDPAALGRLAVVAGGPGTGKTTLVARIVAALAEEAEGAPLVALAAPTAKAADGLRATVHAAAQDLPVSEEVWTFLRSLTASTLHRLLGWRGDTRSRFRHHRENRLPHDVVIVDETSMVSLTMMSRLLEAVRDDARLVLVGDPDQLSSIEAGAVLGDLVAAPSMRGRIAALTRVHRYGGAIGAVADAIREGDADAAVAALRAGGEHVVWLDVDAAGAADLEPIRAAATATGRAVIAAALEGRAQAALSELKAFRLLCAHRRGPYGVTAWTAAAERWLAPEIDAAGGRLRDHPGRPLLVTQNDYDLNLFNGDTGVIVRDGDRLVAAFDGKEVRPNQLASVETVYAMTVHKAQGSQFATAAVILPPPSSRILTRELLYTAVTRAQDRLVVAGTEAAVRAAVARPAARASGLAARLG